MTTFELDALKALAKNCPAGPLVVVQMDSKGNAFQVQTTRANGGVVIATCRNRHNAEYLAAAWEWLPRLVAELEFTREADRPKPTVTDKMTGGGEYAQRTAESGAPVARERQRRKRTRAPV